MSVRCRNEAKNYNYPVSGESEDSPMRQYNYSLPLLCLRRHHIARTRDTIFNVAQIALL